MKLTDSQRSEIRELMRPPVNCVRPNLDGLVRVFERYLERWGGVQWNEYPQTNPTEKGKYMVCLKDHKVDGTPRYQWVEGWWGLKPNEFMLDELVDEWLSNDNVTHWAEINLPNQTPAS